MTAKIIDGKAIGAEVRAEVAERVRKLVERGVQPGFVDLLIGEDAASGTYVRMKNKAAAEAGIRPVDPRWAAALHPALVEGRGAERYGHALPHGREGPHGGDAPGGDPDRGGRSGT